MLHLNKTCVRYSLLCSLVLAGCMQNPTTVQADRPDWLSGEPLEYPNSQYLSANGSADEPERAKDRALANLSKVFEARIRETSTALSDVATRRSDGAETVDSRQRLTRNIQVQTSKILDGARIAEQYYDGAELVHYALAVMDRGQAANNLLTEIDALDEQTSYELQRNEDSTDPIQQVSLLSRAIDYQQSRVGLQKTLKVIDRSGVGKPSPWNLAALREQLENALLQMNMAIAVKQDDLGELPSLVAGAMSHSGFPARSLDYEYILTSALELQPAFERQGWHWLQGTVSLTLTDAGGRVMGNRSWPVRVSSVQAELLKPRMTNELETLLNRELKPAILGFAQGDI